MSITHSVSVRNVLANTAVGLIDIGAGPNGTLVISQVTPTPIDIAIIKFQAKASHAFGLAVDGVCTANALPLEGLVTAPGTTQAQVFSVKGCDGNVIFQGDGRRAEIGAMLRKPPRPLAAQVGKLV